jgi:hypothetical protein
MSDGHDEEYYDEMEWRIVHDENPVKYFTYGKAEGVYRFRFLPNNIKVIIFPDDETKRMSFSDKSIMEFFSVHMPIAVTLDDCDNF